MANNTIEQRYQFLTAQRCRVEWLQSGPNKGTPRVFLGNNKTPYLGQTLNQAIDLAMSFVADRESAPAATARSGTKTAGKPKTAARKTAAVN